MIQSVNMDKLFKFEEIGLDNRDKRVYEALLTTPQTSLRKLADITGINRGSVYESVKKLAHQGLVGSIEVGKQRRFSATDPHAIIELLKERQHQARVAEGAANAYIATLATVTPATVSASACATFYEDHEGIAAILRDVLATCRNRNGNAYRAISTQQISRFMYQNFPNFTQRRIAEHISVRVIGIGNSGNKDKLAERRMLPTTRGEAPNCYTLLYGNKLAFITIDEASILTGTVINNTGISQAQKELFDHLWNTLPAPQ
jgi:sugar-specific transcriptional regulator TrmB